MPKHYTVKKAMAGTKTASEERMLAKNMGAKKMPGGGHTKKAPMFMMGGKTYADMGAMIKAEAGSLIDGLAKNESTFAQMERAVDKKRNQNKGS